MPPSGTGLCSVKRGSGSGGSNLHSLEMGREMGPSHSPDVLHSPQFAQMEETI